MRGVTCSKAPLAQQEMSDGFCGNHIRKSMA